MKEKESRKIHNERRAKTYRDIVRQTKKERNEDG